MSKEEIFPVGYEISDIVREKKALYSALKEAPNLLDYGIYVRTLVAAQRCGLIDDKTYASFCGMGMAEKIPFDVMAYNLHGRLLEDLERDFAREKSTGEDEIIAQVSAEVKMSCL